jgi:hypothetical protein
VSKYGDAAFALMTAAGARTMTTRALWAALESAQPELVRATPTRKTPRSTCFRDLRKDARFRVLGGSVTLAETKAPA